MVRTEFGRESLRSLDLDIAIMNRSTPRRPWFVETTPRLSAIATRTDAVAELAAVPRRNFPK